MADRRRRKRTTLAAAKGAAKASKPPDFAGTTKPRRRPTSLTALLKKSKMKIITVSDAKIAQTTEPWGGGATATFNYLGVPFFAGLVEDAWNLYTFRRETPTLEKAKQENPELAQVCTDARLERLLSQSAERTPREAALDIMQDLQPRHKRTTIDREARDMARHRRRRKK